MRSNSCARWRHDARETVFLIENNFIPVGVVGVDWREPEAPELGYWLGVEHWGQGFATEAARAVIDFTFEEFEVEHLISGARVANPSSRNILEKCGFQWSGVELHRFEALGSSTPVDCFRLSRSVWSSLKNWSSSTRHEAVSLPPETVMRSERVVRTAQSHVRDGDCHYPPSPTTLRGGSVDRRSGEGCEAHAGGLTAVSSRPSCCSRRKM